MKSLAELVSGRSDRLRALEDARADAVTRGEPPRAIAGRVELRPDPPSAVGELLELKVAPPATSSGWRSSEYWLAALLPLICGAVVELGWLTEAAATQLGMTGTGGYLASRTVLKALRERRPAP